MLYDRENNINDNKIGSSSTHINNFKEDIPEIPFLAIIILILFIILIVGIIYLSLN